jgi:hypothetical protein
MLYEYIADENSILQVSTHHHEYQQKRGTSYKPKHCATPPAFSLSPNNAHNAVEMTIGEG